VLQTTWPSTRNNPIPLVQPALRSDAEHPVRAAQVRAVVKSFEAGVPGCAARVLALNGADLDVRPGEVVGLVGEAGSGKSTMLLLLSGMLRPDSGNVVWYSDLGRPVRDLSAVQYLPAWRSSHALQSLKRALADPPGFMLLDDILISLDSVSRREARVMIRELRNARVTMVIASREGSVCGALCSRMLRIRGGRISR
jgi:ABC-type multidrug transport system ATPase subunit